MCTPRASQSLRERSKGEFGLALGSGSVGDEDTDVAYEAHACDQGGGDAAVAGIGAPDDTGAGGAARLGVAEVPCRYTGAMLLHPFLALVGAGAGRAGFGTGPALRHHSGGVVRHVRSVTRAWFLRLVVAADGDPVRVRVRGGMATDEALVERLLAARLISVGDNGNLQLAHEALARHWPRLREWLAEDRAGQRLLRHLSGEALEWDTHGATNRLVSD